MITVNVLAVEQKFDFETKQVRNYIILDMQGTQVRAEVRDLAELEAVMCAGLKVPGGPAEESTPMADVEDFTATVKAAMEAIYPPKVVPAAAPMQAPVSVEQPAVPDILVRWDMLPDDILEPRYKVALKQLGVPTSIMADKLDNLVQSIDEEYSEEDWANALADEAEEPAPAPQPVAFSPPAPVVRTPEPREPPAGQVTWSDGSPIMSRTKHAKTVPMDDYGNPLVPNSGPAASRLVAHGDVVDENGIGQV